MPTIYIKNVTLTQVENLRKHKETTTRDPGGARDPVSFFSFSDRYPPGVPNAISGSLLPAGWVAASKRAGAHASHYLKDMEDRLHRGGLTDAETTATPPSPA